MPTVFGVTDDPLPKAFATSLGSAKVGSDDVIRYVLDDDDNNVASMVQSAELYDDEARAQVRTLLTDSATDALHVFAKRRVVLGRRTANVSYFHQALSAYSLLPTIKDVPWTTWFLGALVLGDYAHDAELVALFGGPYTPGGQRCQTLQKSLWNGGSLDTCHLKEVNTSYGVGMFAMPLPHDVPGRVWSRARTLTETMPCTNQRSISRKWRSMSPMDLITLRRRRRPLWDFRDFRRLVFRWFGLGAVCTVARWRLTIPTTYSWLRWKVSQKRSNLRPSFPLMKVLLLEKAPNSSTSRRNQTSRRTARLHHSTSPRSRNLRTVCSNANEVQIRKTTFPEFPIWNLVI